MIEENFIRFLSSAFPSVPVYSFFIPEDAPSPAFCIENAGYGVAVARYNNKNVSNRTIKLTVSSKNVSDIYNDLDLRKYIENTNTVGELTVLGMKINTFSDNFVPELKIYERTYNVSVKLTETQTNLGD
ncbi:hypothetical protein RA178_06285 [Shewanella oncorhynchi]|uniref:Uncharacterized protein n=1 Tax=Shewanella oncorhynchi TaxID=2726434 RepID=A0AA50KF16_9GAMM|nr:hypothetical protein [Shewanella oncorhynchi]WMB74220.1 hypothetical protein RA178_06285 [Shewanella oncorhynchi]